MAPTTDDFHAYLTKRLATAAATGAPWIELRAGDVHRAVGGYPSPANRMPVCCTVMRALMRDGDTIIAAPPKGNGANVIIRYLLPR